MRQLFSLAVVLGVLGTLVMNAQIANGDETPPQVEGGAESVLPSTDEAPLEEQEGAIVVPPGAVVGEVSPQALSDCPAGAVCGWSDLKFGGQGGQISWWSGPGCYAHLNNNPLYSFANNTIWTVRLGGQGNLPPWEHNVVLWGVYGEICWPV